MHLELRSVPTLKRMSARRNRVMMLFANKRSPLAFMYTALPAKSPRMICPRSMDATGLFWGLVSLVVGLFFAAVFPPFAVVLIAFPFCFMWQLRKWRTDAAIVEAATDWCSQYCPHADDAPVVDFMIALAHMTHIDLRKCTPVTALDTLDWIADDEELLSWYPEAKDRTHARFLDVLAEAKIKVNECSAFGGTTLQDAIRLLQRSHRKG
jgi:hypothetical protein